MCTYFTICSTPNTNLMDGIGIQTMLQFNLIIVQQDATYSVYYITVSSTTCFACWHPSSGAGTAVITASGID